MIHNRALTRVNKVFVDFLSFNNVFFNSLEIKLGPINKKKVIGHSMDTDLSILKRSWKLLKDEDLNKSAFAKKYQEHTNILEIYNDLVKKYEKQELTKILHQLDKLEKESN